MGHDDLCDDTSKEEEKGLSVVLRASQASMRTAQLTERPIYIPKGRRELVHGQSTTPTLLVKSVSAKRPMADQTDTQNKAARCSQQEKDVPLTKDATSSTPATKLVSQKSAFAGIYIPKAKREQMEKDAAKAAEAAAAKQIEPVSSKPVIKAATTSERPTNAYIGNKGTVNPTPSSAPPCAVPQKQTIQTTKAPQTEKLAEASNNTANTGSKPKEVVRGAVYVPKGRRELNEKIAVELPVPPAEPIANSSTSKGTSVPAPPVANLGISVGVSLPSQKPKVVLVEGSGRASPPRSKTYSNWDDSSDDETSNNSSNTSKAPSSVSFEDTIQQCTLVLSGVPTDMSELARGNITRTYAEKGATIKWTSSNECLLMFKSERAAMQMVPSGTASIFRVVRLLDMSGAQKEELMAAARENFVVSKPERDSTVANRLIGAALGIRLPKNLTSNSNSGAIKRAPSPVREDAWDD